MEFLDSLEEGALHKHKKSNRVQSWYFYEQLKSLEQNQAVAAECLKLKTCQDKILHRELWERRERRSLQSRGSSLSGTPLPSDFDMDSVSSAPVSSSVFYDVFDTPASRHKFHFCHKRTASSLIPHKDCTPVETCSDDCGEYGQRKILKGKIQTESKNEKRKKVINNFNRALVNGHKTDKSHNLHSESNFQNADVGENLKADKLRISDRKFQNADKVVENLNADKIRKRSVRNLYYGDTANENMNPDQTRNQSESKFEKADKEVEKLNADKIRYHSEWKIYEDRVVEKLNPNETRNHSERGLYGDRVVEKLIPDTIRNHSEMNFKKAGKAFENFKRGRISTANIINHSERNLADDLKEELESVKKEIAENINLQISTEQDKLQCLEELSKLAHGSVLELKTPTVSVVSVAASEETSSERAVSVCSVKPVRNVAGENFSAFWNKLVEFAFLVIQSNHHGNCFFDYTSQFMTAVLACDMICRGINRLSSRQINKSSGKMGNSLPSSKPKKVRQPTRSLGESCGRSMVINQKKKYNSEIYCQNLAENRYVMKNQSLYQDFKARDSMQSVDRSDSFWSNDFKSKYSSEDYISLPTSQITNPMLKLEDHLDSMIKKIEHFNT